MVFEYFDIIGRKNGFIWVPLSINNALSLDSWWESWDFIQFLWLWSKQEHYHRRIGNFNHECINFTECNIKEYPSKIKEIEKETDEFFTQADLNSDNKINLKEFKRYLKKNPVILNILMNFNIAKKEDLGTDFGSGDVPEWDSDLENEINPPELKIKGKVTQAKQGVEFAVAEGGLFSIDEVGGGDEFMAVKSWRGVIDHSVPSDYKPSKSDGADPDENLKLKYVYGYRCHNVRNNLRYTNDDHFIYHSAALGIWMNPFKNTQRFHFGHKDDIMSFAFHPNGKI